MIRSVPDRWNFLFAIAALVLVLIPYVGMSGVQPHGTHANATWFGVEIAHPAGGIALLTLFFSSTIASMVIAVAIVVRRGNILVPVISLSAAVGFIGYNFRTLLDAACFFTGNSPGCV
jgi:hypothetical protein